MAEQAVSTATTVVGAREGANSHRPHRGRSGRARGGRQRGGSHAQERNHGAEAADAPAAQAPATGRVEGSSASNVRGGRGRGRGGHRNPRHRGAEIGPRSNFAAQRTFGGHLTTEQAPSDPTPAGLSGDAPEFVPGQPVTTARDAPPTRPRGTKSHVAKKEKSTAPDLPTRIHEDIINGQYECVICTNEVLRNSRVWSCSICWTVAHLSCVRKWHSNQMKKPEQPGAPVSDGWRCPGCNSHMTEEPASYHCWCGKELNPTSIPGLPPHSCSQTCGKPRSTCPHPCPLICHAGPCPPCGQMGPSLSCFCGKHTSQKRCSETDYANGWSCGEVCGDILPCGEHSCERSCHSGLCGSCEVPIPSLCYCGREFKEVPCEQRGDKAQSFNHGQVKASLTDLNSATENLPDSWFWGSFSCETECGRLFDCGHHNCHRICHAQDEEEAHCPFSPDVVTHCPCGKTPLTEILDIPRNNCQDEIPRCQKTCDKMLSCGHRCVAHCHAGSCPPCMQKIEVACRCGRTTTPSICHQGVLAVPECMRVCRAQLNCGRHTHDVHCCPAEKKAQERVAARRKRKNLNAATEEVEAEHICLRVCGRMLKCGNHTCSQLCHSGPCPTCLEAVFDEIRCHCGRTVLHPPQPCGTQPPECRFECTRSNPACGHPRVSHNCHTDDKPCPPCPFLVEKKCICGKQTLKNQPCWFEEPRCGLPCGKKLKCGTHTCTKSCHKPGECEDAGIKGSHCSQPCMKVRKSCDHVDTDPCHAPFPCKEDKPCQSKTFITCPCQRRKQEVRCMASKSNPFPDRTTLKCDDECLRLQRNAKLAAALSIDPEHHSDDHVPYSDATLRFFGENMSWAATQEREFRVFANDPDQKVLRFKPMKSNQRAFIHSLAEDYGFDSESQDPEPHRHTSLFKTPRFVAAPTKTLAQCLKIRAVQQSANLQAQLPPPTIVETPSYNALLLSAPRFGLTIEELQSALKPHFKTQPTVSFTISFLSTDEVVLRGSGAWTPQALESSLSSLKPLVTATVQREGIAKHAFLCHVDSSLNVLRREVSASGKSDGWSSVVSRSTMRHARLAAVAAANGGGGGGGAAGGEGKAAPSKFVALKPRRKVVEKEPEPVEEDWEVAAEKLDAVEKQEDRVGDGDGDVKVDEKMDLKTEAETGVVGTKADADERPR